ncbi:MAG TPA: hypothetical protein VGG28_04260 [Kofleriaceae bacterium]|jgi:hypothetical protein
MLIVAACGSSTIAAPATAPSPTALAATAPSCTVDTEYWADSEPIDPQTPIAVVIANNGWGNGEDRPAIAVWPDGAVLDAGKVGHITPARAVEIAHAVAAALRAVPPRVSLTDAFDTPSTLIAARDGKRWRVVRVEGLAFRGVQGVASVRAANGRPDQPEPDAIAQAIAAFDPVDKAAKPTEYTPVELVLEMQQIPPHTSFAEDWPGAPLDWPTNWPAPPQTKNDDPFELVVSGKLAAEVEAFADKMWQTKQPVKIRAASWMFYVRERFRGEDAIETVAECADTEYVKRWNAANPR